MTLVYFPMRHPGTLPTLPTRDLLKPDFGLISFSFAFLELPVMTKSCIHYRHDDVFRPEHF